MKRRRLRCIELLGGFASITHVVAVVSSSTRAAPSMGEGSIAVRYVRNPFPWACRVGVKPIASKGSQINMPILRDAVMCRDYPPNTIGTCSLDTQDNDDQDAIDDCGKMTLTLFREYHKALNEPTEGYPISHVKVEYEGNICRLVVMPEDLFNRLVKDGK